MKKLLAFALLIILSITLFAEADLSLDEINQQAISAYQDKDYESALEQFLIIDTNGIISADLFYNIANCYFRQGSLGLSILYYEKYLKVKPDHIAARKNRDFALTLTRDKIEKTDKSALENLLSKLYNSFDLNSAALITLILFALLITFLIITQIAYRNRDKSLPVFFIFLIIFRIIF